MAKPLDKTGDQRARSRK